MRASPGPTDGVAGRRLAGSGSAMTGMEAGCPRRRQVMLHCKNPLDKVPTDWAALRADGDRRQPFGLMPNIKSVTI